MCAWKNFAKNRLRCTALFLLTLFLLGMTPVRAAEAEPRMLVPVGHTVGVKLFARGVLVVALPEEATPARKSGLRTGDVITHCGETAVTSTEQFQSLLQEAGTRATSLQVKRKDSRLTLRVEPVKNEEGVCCIGAWIRDSMAGIGTMTYYDPQTQSFGALGHGITDVDTAVLMPFSGGSILPSTVKAVKKGAAGSAGELRGDFALQTTLGTLSANTDHGIFGELTAEYAPAAGEALPVGTAVKGPAEILSNVAGDAVGRYDIEILKTIDHASDCRDMVISITDADLLAVTGGIVQGMSGSPIIQNGKIVGAVTHVLVNDPTRGYGISIENMLRAAG